MNARAWRGLVALYALTAVVVALGRVDNNYLIFRVAAGHLADGAPLYRAAPALHEDLFKYTPVAAWLLLPLAWLPVRAGLALWTAANVLGPAWGLRRVLRADGATAIALAVAYLDVLRSAQRAQSNGVIAAAVLLAYAWWRDRRDAPAGAAIAAATFLKLFPAAGALLALRRRDWWRPAAWGLGAAVVLALLPAATAGPRALATAWRDFLAIQRLDAATGEAWPVVPTAAGIYGGVLFQLRLWFGVGWPNWTVQAVGTALLLVPFAVRWRDRADEGVGVRLLASVLCYMVLFNHRAESPTYVLAMCGIAAWYAAGPRRWWHHAVAALCVAFVSVSSTDLVPRAVQDAFFVRYWLKTPPVLLAWLLLQWELLRTSARPASPASAARSNSRGA